MTFHKKIFSVVFIFFLTCGTVLILSNSKSAQADEGRILRHDLAVVRQHRIEENKCSELRLRREGSACRVTAHRTASRRFLNPIIASTFRNIAFLYEEAEIIDILGDSGQISKEAQEKSYRQLKAKIDEEGDYMISRLEASYAESDIRREQARSDALLNWSLGVLSNTFNTSRTNNSSSSHRSYVINGKIITCRDQGNLTICN